jgi:hypothetical protein
MEIGAQRHAPATLPAGKNRYPLYRRLGGPQRRSGRVRKISSAPGFDLRTVQLVASRYTVYAIPAAIYIQCVPLATETGILLEILNVNRSTFVV